MKINKSETEKVIELIDIIENSDGIISIPDFKKFCATNDYWSEFRRSGNIFCKIIDEHNTNQNNNTISKKILTNLK